MPHGLVFVNMIFSYLWYDFFKNISDHFKIAFFYGNNAEFACTESR